MPRARALRSSFFTHEYLATCDPLEDLLFAGLWTESDRMGRLEDRPVQLKARILPMRNCDVIELLDRLERAGLIMRYQIGEQRLIWVPKFVEQQKSFTHPNEPRSRLPRHPADTNEETGPARDDPPKVLRRRSSSTSKGRPKEVRRRSDLSDRSDPSDHSDRSDRSDDLGDPRPRKRSWQELIFEEMQATRVEKLRARGIDEKPERVNPALLNMVIAKIAEEAGGDDREAALRAFDSYLEETWPADKAPPYAFQVFASEKVWRKQLEKSVTEPLSEGEPR